MSMMWVGISSAVLGAGTSLYGANKQKKAVEGANEQNAALQQEQNQSAWNAYLLSRGINPTGAKTGEIPVNAQAVNTRLPLWATANFKNPGAKPVWRKKGTTTPQGTLAMSGGSMPGAPTMPVTNQSFRGGGNPWEIN